MKSILIALISTVAITFLLQWWFEYRVPGAVVLLVYFLFYGLSRWGFRGRKREASSGDAVPDRSHWPLSGPLRRLGPKLGGGIFLSIFQVTSMVSLLNPFQALQMVRQVIGNDHLKRREEPIGGDRADYRCKARYRLPVTGGWLVFNGGDTPDTSHSWDILGQRFALDLVRADADLRRHEGEGRKLEEYFSYGQEIVAAADGTVVSVEDRVADAPLVGWGFCDFTARHFAGSHVILQHAEGEFAVYAHLIEGSTRLQPGDPVRQGECVGRCGHSGHSTEPHLHFHLQDSPDLFRGMGLPVEFEEIFVEDERVASARVRAGQRVRNGRAGQRERNGVEGD